MSTDAPARKLPPKMDPDTPAWERAARQLARSYCPAIYPCADCGGPVIKGYCCARCGSESPERGSGK